MKNDRSNNSMEIFLLWWWWWWYHLFKSDGQNYSAVDVVVCQIVTLTKPWQNPSKKTSRIYDSNLNRRLGKALILLSREFHRANSVVVKTFAMLVHWRTSSVCQSDPSHSLFFVMHVSFQVYRNAFSHTNPILLKQIY